MKRVLTFVILWFLLITCQKQPYTNEIFIPRDIVIAHRGTTYWAPEETEMAYRWARNIGAHYLEADIQRSKDGVLLALHDDKLTRTTNIEEIFPDRTHESSSQFSFEELLQLDAGSWFGNDCMSCSKDYYFSQNKLVETTQDPIFFDEDGNANSEILNQTIFIGGGQGISTLEDVIRIAEGYRIAKDSIGKRIYKKIEIEGSVEYIFYYVKDMDDGGHRPGVYLETKEPHLFPNIEQDLFNELNRLNWNVVDQKISDTLITKNGLVNIAHTSAKVILQTFSQESLIKLQTVFKKQVPVCFLLWLGDANMPVNDSISYHNNLFFARKYGAQIIGPSIQGSPNNYSDLLNDENYHWIRNQGFLIHPYSFDTPDQMMKYGPLCDGMFTNLADLTLLYYSKIKDSQ